MPYFDINDEKYQEELRAKLQDLEASLSLSNHKWTEWEFDFIESLAEKLQWGFLNLTHKQQDIIHTLWDKL